MASCGRCIRLFEKFGEPPPPAQIPSLSRINCYLPDESPLVEQPLKAAITDDRFDGFGWMHVGAKWIPGQLEEKVFGSQRDLHPPGIAREDQAVNLTRPRYR